MKSKNAASQKKPVLKKIFRAVRRYGIQLLTLAIIIYALVFYVKYNRLVEAFSNVAWAFVLLALLANLASIMLKVASWKLIYDYTFEGVRGRWRDLTSGLMIGFLVNLVIPARVGELARAFVVSRRQGLLGQPVSRSTVFGTIVLERVFDGVTMAMIVIYGIVHMDMPGWAGKGAIVLLTICFFFAIVMIVLETKREKLQKGAEQTRVSLEEKHHPMWRRLGLRLFTMIARFSEGQKVLRSPGRLVAICFSTSASWMSQLTAVYFSLYAFHLERIGMLGALLLLILINVAGALPATPGNVGVFQLATVIPLTATYGVPTTRAIAFSVGLQMIEGSIGVGGGGICLLREGLKFNQVRTGARELEDEAEEEADDEIEEEPGEDTGKDHGSEGTD